MSGKRASIGLLRKITDSISDELLTGSRRFEYGQSYAMLLGALRNHLKNDCVALNPS